MILYERGAIIFMRSALVRLVAATTSSNDDFSPDISNFFIDDMGDNINANASAAAALYAFLIFLFHTLLEFLLVVVALDSISLSTVLVDRMISLILLILVIICLLFSRIKSTAKLLIFSTRRGQIDLIGADLGISFDSVVDRVDLFFLSR